MVKRWITENRITKYRIHLINQEKSPATVEKYIRDIRKFSSFLPGERISREQVLAYKKYLTKHYKTASVNSMLAALNSFLTWQGLQQYRVKPLKLQRQIFRSQEKELSKQDYSKLLAAALDMGDERLHLIMQTICATGIRISELSWITAESLSEGCIQVTCKNKARIIWMPGALLRQLKSYIRRAGIGKGSVFITGSGRPLSRCFVWKQMKQAARKAGISERKVYPHNLRHLFARTFYEMNKDIVKLSDILGHSSMETTRIYTMTTGKEHAGYLEKLGLAGACS